MTTKGTTAKAVIVPDDFKPSFISNNLTIIRVNNELYSPYVLLKYQDPATQLWLIRPFQVLAKEDPYDFVYPATAGRAIQPPYPLSQIGRAPCRERA